MLKWKNLKEFNMKNCDCKDKKKCGCGSKKTRYEIKDNYPTGKVSKGRSRK